MITYARSGDADCLADLSVTDKVFKLLDKTRPEIIINLVGLTDVDHCETQPNQAYLLNVRTVENTKTGLFGCSTNPLNFLD